MFKIPTLFAYMKAPKMSHDLRYFVIFADTDTEIV